ncbi:glycosyltransferase family 4 protein [Paenibacillus thermoaerophilus]|uniref:Glycosyltransferase family 4 protein n=1 Tax=Paenibacillus thermoaerophilus TaxID=1215385 RepID=A0ABW2V458_9BACL|nr:glycosyltransferase family 4 protein [Paenibacillus thermoaerophilus]TMV16158.1 glycosyltransferase [Paenibacillus thermoaerophilus]
MRTMLVVTAENPFPQDSGGKLRTGNLLKIVTAHFRTDVLTYRGRGPDTGNPLPNCRFIYVERRPRSGRRLMIRTLYRRMNHSYMSHSDLDFAPHIRELCRSTSYDCVLIAHTLLGAHLRLIRKLLPEALIVTDAHNFETQLTRQLADGQRGLVRKLFFRLNHRFTAREERRIAKTTDQLWVASEDDAELFVAEARAPRHKVSLIPNFLDHDEYEADADAGEPPVTLPTGERRIILPGNMNYFPNVNGALHFHERIYPELKRRVPGIKWYIVGKDCHPSVRRLAENDETIVVTGYVKHIQPYIRQSDVVIVPLLEGGGTRLKILEAWALGVPVVSTSKGAEGLEYEAGRHLLVADEPEPFAEAVATLLSNRRLAGAVAFQARQKLLENYELQAVEGRVLRLLNAHRPEEGRVRTAPNRMNAGEGL